MTERTPELQARLDAVRARYQQLRDDPATPQGLTDRGQSGSALDYQEADELGDLICSAEGHRLVTTFSPVWSFCPRCGSRIRAKTGETSKLIVDAQRWEAEDA